MEYAKIPETISYKDVINHQNKSLSPSDHIAIKVNCDYKLLEDFILSSTTGKEVGSFNYMENSNLKFIRTKCLQANSILLNLSEAIGVNPLKFRQFNLEQKDILVVKDSNIGEVCYLDEDLPNYAISGGVVQIKLNNNLDKFYIIGIMKSSFFKEQIDLMTPKGATIRHSKDAYKYAKIPIPDDKSIIKKISILTQSLIKKERELRDKFELINKTIEDELQNNQKSNNFSNKNLSYNDLIEHNRFDTGLYTEEFKKTEYFIKNYKNGSDTITNLGFYSIRGQNLAVSVIGKSIYSSNHKNNFYQLILPTNINKYGTIDNLVYFGNKNELINFQNNDIIFGAEATFVSFIPIGYKGKLTTNYHGTILRSDTAPTYQKIFIKCMLDWFRDKKVLKAYAVGGNGGSFSTKYWKILHFPLFGNEKQKQIARLYSNPNYGYLEHINNFSIEKFNSIDKNVNQNSGILDLDKQIKLINKIINQEIKNIITGEL
jgi:hypothetical protein